MNLSQGKLNFDEETERSETASDVLMESDEAAGCSGQAGRRHRSLRRGKPISLTNGLHAPIHEILQVLSLTRE